MGAKVKMQRDTYLVDNSGIALLMAIIIMFIVTALAMTMMVSSTTDMKVSGNTLKGRKAFYLADGGQPMSMKLIEETIDDRAIPTSYSAVTIDSTFLNEILGLYETNPSLNDKNTDTPQNNPDIVSGNIGVDVDRFYKTISSTGGASSFGAGAEGIGYGSSGSTFIFYGIDSLGVTDNASSEIVMTYRKVVNVGGK